MDRLDQLVARSQREIEAHTHELGDTDSGRYFINEASHLLAALRLWAQSQYRTDHVVRDILEAGDVVALHDVSRELQEIGTHDGQAAGRSITTITNRSSGELMTIGSSALRAL
jgi:dipeptidyl aminopeptidase/acylaminoacyl peptidase